MCFGEMTNHMVLLTIDRRYKLMSHKVETIGLPVTVVMILSIQDMVMIRSTEVMALIASMAALETIRSSVAQETT